MILLYYYSLTVTSVSAVIDVVSRRHALFRVTCTSTGGRAVNMTVTGPDLLNSDLNSIQAVGDPQGMGHDTFSASTAVVLGGRDRDVYQCIVSNSVSPGLGESVELTGWNIHVLPKYR